MAYEKTEWKSGDTITAEKLNKIESGVKDNEKGWEISKEYELILEEEVTTEDDGYGYIVGYFSNSIDDNLIIRVTFNGNEYECVYDEDDGYGANYEYDSDNDIWKPNFTNYPFSISSDSIRTQSVGIYQIKVEKLSKKVILSEDFKYMFDSAIGIDKEVKLGGTQRFILGEQNTYYSYETFNNFFLPDYKSIIVYLGNEEYNLDKYICNYDNDDRWVPENSTDFFIGYNRETNSYPIYIQKTEDSNMSGAYYVTIAVLCKMIDVDDSYYYYLVNEKLRNHSPILQLSLAPGYENGIAMNTDTARGKLSTAFGRDNVARGYYSFVAGSGNIAYQRSQFIFGEYSSTTTYTDNQARGNYIEIVGNGQDNNNRSNARTLDWWGNETLAGSITLGKGTADEVTLTAAQVKQLLALLNN